MDFSFLEILKVIAVTCTQWGDTGKGKIVDLLATVWADIIARGTGGANAGHTIRVGDQEYIFHLIPSGILQDRNRKFNIIGNGVVFDPQAACNELAILRKGNLSYNNLLIAYNAKLVLPQHILEDRLRESGSSRIGTTGRGIGPAYRDYYDRCGLFVNDLLNPDVFVHKVRRNLETKAIWLKGQDPDLVKEIMHHPLLDGGAFYSPQSIFDLDAICEKYKVYGFELREMITNTDLFIQNALDFGQKILLEGAQGNLLSVRYGTYPYVTPSDSSVRGLADGVGLTLRDVDMNLGVTKAFYMTRVGSGPFPTECGSQTSADWCSKGDITRDNEALTHREASVNHPDEFVQGVGIRIAGGEYGATTGRPRRTGWLDLPMLRHSVKISGSDIVLTKVDVLDACETIRICTSYQYQGEQHWLGNRLIKSGHRFSVAPMQPEILDRCTPIYEDFPGWLTPISEIRAYQDLPLKLQTLIEYVQNSVQAKVRIVSVGPDRDQTIFV